MVGRRMLEVRTFLGWYLVVEQPCIFLALARSHHVAGSYMLQTCSVQQKALQFSHHAQRLGLTYKNHVKAIIQWQR